MGIKLLMVTQMQTAVRKKNTEKLDCFQVTLSKQKKYFIMTRGCSASEAFIS